MKKSLGSVLASIGILLGLMLIIVRKGVWGAGVILVGLSALLFVVSILSGLFYHGKKVQGRNRHP